MTVIATGAGAAPGNRFPPTAALAYWLVLAGHGAAGAKRDRSHPSRRHRLP